MYLREHGRVVEHGVSPEWTLPFFSKTGKKFFISGKRERVVLIQSAFIF